jgi:hypothetical protein
MQTLGKLFQDYKRSGYAGSEMDWINFVAATEYCYRKCNRDEKPARSLAGLFSWLVRGLHWDRLTEADTDRARLRIAHYRDQVSAPIQRAPAAPQPTADRPRTLHLVKPNQGLGAPTRAASTVRAIAADRPSCANLEQQGRGDPASPDQLPETLTRPVRPVSTRRRSSRGGPLSRDAQLTLAIIKLAKQRSFSGDPFALTQRIAEPWTRERWDASVSELQDHGFTWEPSQILSFAHREALRSDP